MALTSTFYDAVASGSVRKIRIVMKNSLLMDPTFSEYKEMEKEAASMEGLYDKHDGRDFKLDQSLWDEDYMAELMVQVIGNFSHERINHLKEVVRYLRPVEEKTSKQNQSLDNEKPLSYQEQKRKDQLEGNYRGAKVAAGAIAGAAVGGAVAYAAGVTVAGGVAVGAVVGGTAVYIGTAERSET